MGGLGIGWIVGTPQTPPVSLGTPQTPGAPWTRFLVLLALLLTGCGSTVSPREVALRSTVEALREEVAQLRSRAPDPGASALSASTPSPVVSISPEGLPTRTPRDWWVASHRPTTLWSASSGGTGLTLVAQWSYLLVLESQVGNRLHLFLPGGQGNSYVGDGWAEASDLGPVSGPPSGAVNLATIPRERPTATATPRPSPTAGPDRRLLDWRMLTEKTEFGDLELAANAMLLGQRSYGGPYGSRIAASAGTKIVLIDLGLRYSFRPGASPSEVHVDFFVMGDPAGLEYKGLPVPTANALPDRFFLSPGQGFRGIVAFIVPEEMRSARLYFTNFLGGRTPPERLTVYLRDIP